MKVEDMKSQGKMTPEERAAHIFDAEVYYGGQAYLVGGTWRDQVGLRPVGSKPLLFVHVDEVRFHPPEVEREIERDALLRDKEELAAECFRLTQEIERLKKPEPEPDADGMVAYAVFLTERKPGQKFIDWLRAKS